MNGAVIARQFELSGYALDRNLDGVSRAQSLAIPAGGGSSINWVVGHILRSREARIFATLGLESIWSDPRQELYGKDKTPADLAGREVSVGEMVRRFERSQPILLSRLQGMSEEDLNAPLDEPHDTFGKTVGDMVSFFAWHEAYHVGQLAVLRRAGDTP
jgi:uncharacterized damage-inducible protein DinB